MSAPAAEVMRRGARLWKLHAAGVVDPIRYVGSNREMRDALKPPPVAIAEPPAVVLIGCKWCGGKTKSEIRVCIYCRDLEATLLAYERGDLTA